MTRSYSVNCGVGYFIGADIHLTLFYLGQQDELQMNKFVPLDKLYNRLNQLDWPIRVVCKDELSYFGENNNVPVAELKPSTSLHIARLITVDFFRELNIHSKSNFTEFKPHISNPRPDIPSFGINIYFPQLISWESTSEA